MLAASSEEGRDESRPGRHEYLRHVRSHLRYPFAIAGDEADGRSACDAGRFGATNMNLTPSGIWHFYDGRAGMEPRICELREDFALRKIPTASFAANALYLEVIRLAYNLVTAFQRTSLQESWQNLTLGKLRYKLFLLPGELTRPKTVPFCGSRNLQCYASWSMRCSARLMDSTLFRTEAHRFSRRIQVCKKGASFPKN